jgi:Tryptophanyl-tRNA synthetase
MSKSEESDYSRINLTDSSDDIVKKIKKAKTDSLSIPDSIKDLEGRPEALNLLNIYSSLKNSKIEKTLEQMAGKDFSKFKENLSEILIDIICPIGKKIKDLKKDENYLQKILEDGSSKASKIATKNLKEIKKIVGFPLY